MNKNNQQNIFFKNIYLLIFFLILSGIFSFLNNKLNNFSQLIIIEATIYYSVFWIIFTFKIKSLENSTKNFPLRIDDKKNLLNNSNDVSLKNTIKNELNNIEIEFHEKTTQLNRDKTSLEIINITLRMFAIVFSLFKIFEMLKNEN